jgi:flagellar basal-body rod protein FlgC
MDYFKASEISAAGMNVQRARIEAAAMNLANLNSTALPGTPGYRPLTAVIRSDPKAFARALSPGVDPLPVVRAEVVTEIATATRLLYEPGHPHADETGYVLYPGIDQTKEMMSVMTALRGYEANLTVLQVTKALAAKALEIGAT